MKKYKFGSIDVELDDRDFLLTTAIDNLANEIKKLRTSRL